MPAFLVALVVILVALFAAGPIVRRVRQLTESVRKLGSDSEEPIRVEGHDEIAELGTAFEQSRQTIHAQLASLREREAALRNYIANTTHDVMLPLSVLQGHLVSLQQRIEGGETLDAQADRAEYRGVAVPRLAPPQPQRCGAPRSQRRACAPRPDRPEPSRRTRRRPPSTDRETKANRTRGWRARAHDRVSGRPHAARAGTR